MIVRTRPEWEGVVEKLKKSRDADGIRVVSYDTETVDKGYPDIHIVGFSVAGYEDDGKTKFGAYVPVGHNTGELQLSPQDVQDGLAEVIEDPEVEVVMHNAKYDIAVSTLFPRRIRVSPKIFDTMTAAWLTNTNGVGSYMQVLTGNGSLGLKDLSLHLLGHKMTELTDLAKKEKQVNARGAEIEVLRVDLVKIEDLGAYAWDDAIQTLALREHLKPKLQADPKVWKIFDEIEREFIHCLAEMEMGGVELDIARLLQMRRIIEGEMAAVKERMFQLRPGEDFDRIADERLVKHLAEEWDRLDELFTLPKTDPRYPKNAKGGPAGKGAVRKQLIAASGLEGHPVVEKIRDDKLRPDIKRWPYLAHKIFNVNSNKDLNKVLFDECGIEPIGELGANGLWSTDADNIDTWAKLGHPMARELQRYREVSKLYGTYLVGMVGTVADDNRVRTRFGRVRTGRLSSSDPNLQNIPTSQEFPIRQAFVATGVSYCNVEIYEWSLDDKGNPVRPKHFRVEAIPGNPLGLEGGYVIDNKLVVEWWGTNPPWVMFVGDYSQLEICLLAHVSADPVLVEAIRKGEDIHALTAQAVFDEIPKDISLKEVKKRFPHLRSGAKPVNFGVIYGMGPTALAAQLGTTVQEAEEIINVRYMNKYVGVKAWIERQHAFARRNGYVQTAIGRKRHLPAATLDPSEKKNFSLIKQAERQAQNCVDAETEILTVDGWKRYDEISEGTVILTKNPETDGLEWHPIKKLCVFPQSVGRLVEFESKTFSALTTEDHRWLVYNKSTGRDEFKLSREISVWGDHRIHRTGSYGGKEVYSDDFVELVGWFLTDGSLRPNTSGNTSGKTYKAYLCQSHRAKPHNCARIDALVRRMGALRRVEVMDGRYSATKWHLTLEMANRLAELFPNRVLTPAFLQQLSGRQARLLVDVMLLGDGHAEAPKNANRKGRRRFTCGSEEQANLFQMLCVLAGYATTVTYRDMSKYRPKSDKLRNVPHMTGVWVVNILNRDKVQVTKSQMRVFESDGRLVWCPQVQNQTFVARRRGTVYITGNTPIQGFAADVVGLAMRDIRRFFQSTLLDPDNPVMFMDPSDGAPLRVANPVLWGNWMRMLLQVHDELVQEAHPAVANYVRAESVRLMENAGGLGPKLRVPLKVDAALGTDWYTTKE